MVGIRVGDWVQVRSLSEILSTLDDNGCLDALPFMPEMARFCGETVRVSKSAHKTCDTISTSGHSIRRMANAVHLADLRCDGGGHGGCQAGCLLFWKEAWLIRLDGSEALRNRVAPPHEADSEGPAPLAPVPETLVQATRVEEARNPGDRERYRCQATEITAATEPAAWWDPRLYARDLTSGNVGIWAFVRSLLIAALNAVLRHTGDLWSYPSIKGLCAEKTPSEKLDLTAGEWVQVRSKDEIVQTLNSQGRNRGLTFDLEMLPHCSKTVRVLRRAERFIDDRTGFMLAPPNPCIVLDGVTCGARFVRRRLFCPRSIYPFWHEIWLRRVSPKGEGHS